jgi:hypothetical protein
MIATVVGYVIAVVSLAGPRLLDDGYYYLQIAFNLSRGLGSSFDGIHQTNGYQPLWQIVLVPIFWATSSKVVAAYAATALQVGLFVGAGCLLGALVRQMNGSRLQARTAGALWLLNAWIVNKAAWTGMETGLYVCALAAAVYATALYLRGRAGPWVVGAYLAVVTLARLDGIAFTLGVLAATASVRRGLHDTAVIALGPAVTLAGYLGLSWQQFGHPLPVSGFLKAANGRRRLVDLLVDHDPAFLQTWGHNVRELASLGGRLPVWLLALVTIAVVAYGARLYPRSNGPSRRIAVACIVGNLLIAAYYTAFYDHLLDEYTYYWMPAAWTACLLIALGIAPFAASSTGARGIAGAIGGALALLAAFYVPDLVKTFETEVARAIVVASINRETPADAVIGSWDAGYIGYFSDRRVVNLDGLVNDYAFAETLAAGAPALPGYVRATGIRYLANVDYDGLQRHRWIASAFGASDVLMVPVPVNRLTTRLSVSRWAARRDAPSGATAWAYVVFLSVPDDPPLHGHAWNSSR